MSEESAVKVCVRVRPLIAREESTESENADPVQLLWKADKKSINLIDDGNSTKNFNFDRVFTADETTNQLYQDIAKPLVVSSVEGYNGTIFAYGQTSSGKTFTMMGSDHKPGVIPLAVEDVFHTIKNCPKKEFLLRVSYMEIYNETVTDLLVDSWKRKPLEVRETLNKNVYVADLTEELVTSPAQALAWIRKGEKNRHYGKTKMNQRSSRSHAIFRMILESRERSDPASGENADAAIIVSHLNLVDLAGSERASQTGAEGTRFKEGCNINRSLFTLGQVMKKLTDESQKGFTNYRDSKLTRILQNSLGGNAKTVIICTVTPVALDETLSTLQFASTAKKMRNDPHVTEVSDDGALLKRYRNEIVDLKRRLHEVSSVTQTTATEKEVLSQLLLEKDQLQREQEDRIKNLTKLLVTSSNLVSGQKRPKRRVTWGGKMLRLARQSAAGSSDLSFADPFFRKRKADQSCLTELGEDDEDFDCQWEIPDETPDEMEMSRGSVTVRSFQDSPKDFVYEERMRELSGKVSHLELQLEVETRQRHEAAAKVADLELQLQAEAQQKREAAEQVEMLELKVADLQLQLDEQSLCRGESDEQMRGQFAEAVNLCETLSSEKETALGERDSLRQRLALLTAQNVDLEAQNAALSLELKERSDLEEFESLEQEFRKEHQDKLQNEISSLKKSVESSEVQRLDLQNQVEALSAALKKKNDFAEELQSMSGKDLVQEVATLRRSLDDAKGLSIDTKKEWAVLRSQNIALEETVGSLTASHQELDAELNRLRLQLETEKTRYRNMQNDLQKELNVVFDENTKLTTLLDGKVPKHLADSVELERAVANLSKELAASREAEAVLGARLEDLASSQLLPETVDSLTKQVCELTTELSAVQTQRDGLLSASAGQLQEAQRLGDALQASRSEVLEIQAELSSAALREEELSRQRADLSQQLENSGAEKSRLTATAESTRLKLEESERHGAVLEEKLTEMKQLMEGLEEKLADSENSRVTEEEISRELQEQLDQLTEELQVVRAEREQGAGAQVEDLLAAVTAERDQLRLDLQMAAETQGLLKSLQDDLEEQRQKNWDLVKAVEQRDSDIESLSRQLQSLQEEKEALLMATEEGEAMASLTAERDQLRLDLQENVEMMIENQEELRTALEKIREQKEQIKRLQTSSSPSCGGQQEEVHTHVKALTQQLQSLEAERDQLLSAQRASCSASREQQEALQSRAASLSRERDQLQEALQGLRQEKQQLRAEVEDRVETVEQLQASLQAAAEQKSQLENDLRRNKETAAEAESILHSLQQQLQEQNQRSTELDRLSQEGRVQLEQQVAETLSRLCSAEDELRKQKLKALEDVKAWEQKDSDSQQQVKALTQQLQSLEAERDQLLSAQRASCSASREQQEALQSRAASLSRERDQLQEALQGLKQEKQQLRAEVEDRVETLQMEIAALQETSRELKLALRQQVESAEREAERQQQLLSDANRTASALREQLSGPNRGAGGAEQTAAARLQDSAAQLQEVLGKFQHFIDTCSKYNSSVMDKALSVEKQANIRSLPKPTMSHYGTVCQLGRQTVISLGNIMDYLQVQAQIYMNLFEELVKKDLAVFEERRLQDVLLCRAQAPRFSVRDQDLHPLWEQRLTELLDKRQLYLQKMLSVSQKLWADMEFLPAELSAVISERERFEEQLHVALNAQPISSGVLDGVLSSELEHRSAVIWSRKMALQGLTDSHNGLCEELKQLEAQADAQLREEWGKSAALLQPLEGATPKTEPCLLNDHQQVILKLQQTEEQLRALRMQNEQLEAAQAKSSDRLSSHKHATQLLQTELQDSRAEVEEKENTIRTLRSLLSESEKKASPAAAELEKLRTQVFRMEVELSSTSDAHQQEIRRMTTLLSEKEESLRRLKESLRAWQQGDESLLQGEDLHARLTNARGLTGSGTAALEQEVRRLRVKVTALESSASSQQAEVSKWKSRAVKLKARSQTEADRPSPPRTPTKRAPPGSADACHALSPPTKLAATPAKALDSPKRSLLDSPKSRFFDAGSSAELLSRTCPRPFFDNSGLGTIPDAALGPRLDDRCSESPKEDVCRTQ